MSRVNAAGLFVVRDADGNLHYSRTLPAGRQVTAEENMDWNLRMLRQLIESDTQPEHEVKVSLMLQYVNLVKGGVQVQSVLLEERNRAIETQIRRIRALESDVDDYQERIEELERIEEYLEAQVVELENDVEILKSRRSAKRRRDSDSDDSDSLPPLTQPRIM